MPRRGNLSLIFLVAEVLVPNDFMTMPGSAFDRRRLSSGLCECQRGPYIP